MALNVFTDGKPNLESVAQVLDPLLSDNFRLEFPGLANLGGGSLGAGLNTKGVGSVVPIPYTDVLTIQCQSATKPGSELEPVAVELFGHSIQYAGRLTFSHSLSIEFVEDRRAAVTTILTNWQRLARKIQTQHGGYKSDYALKKAVLHVYDQGGGNPLKSFNIINIWPSSVPDISFNGAGATLITVGATFTYDYYEDVKV